MRFHSAVSESDLLFTKSCKMVAFLNSLFLKNLSSKPLLARTSSFITTSALIQLQSQKAYVQIMPDS